MLGVGAGRRDEGEPHAPGIRAQPDIGIILRKGRFMMNAFLGQRQGQGRTRNEGNCDGQGQGWTRDDGNGDGQGQVKGKQKGRSLDQEQSQG